MRFGFATSRVVRAAHPEPSLRLPAVRSAFQKPEIYRSWIVCPVLAFKNKSFSKGLWNRLCYFWLRVLVTLIAELKLLITRKKKKAKGREHIAAKLRWVF